MLIYHVSFPGLGWNFQINPVAIKIGNFEIMWYGIIIATGFLLAFLYGLKNCKRFNLDPEKFTNIALVALICGIIGARLYYVIFFPGNQYINNPLSILNIHQGGLAIYGGIIGGITGGIIVSKIQKQSIPNVLDIAALGLLIGQGIGRWGNFVNQEAFGELTDLPWRMVSENTFGLGVHPCFLYESVWCLIGFILLHIFSKKYYRYKGQIFLLYIVWYGMERFIVEGIRTDSLFVPGIDLRVSQVLALACVFIGTVLLIVFRKKTGKLSPKVKKVSTIKPKEK
jgi:phosphatidylglycerol:prolipoprotein diacylglycerol transferase